MNQKALKVLEYDKIIELLTEKATCDLGRAQCRELVPMHDLEEVRLAQKQTADALRRVYAKGSVSFSGTKSVGASLKRLEIGGSLNAVELLRICKLLETAGRVKQYSRGEERLEGERDSLDDFFDALEPCFPLSSEIRRCILSEEDIADDARDIDVVEDEDREMYLVAIQVYGKKLLRYDISNGMLKTIYYIVELFTMSDNSLVLIDEFENGLGVNCIDLLSEILLSERKDLQFIITSHHPKIINGIEQNRWKIIDRDGSIVKNSNSEKYGIGNSQHEAYFNLINRWEFEGKI